MRKFNWLTLKVSAVILCLAFPLYVSAANNKADETSALIFGFLPVVSAQKLVVRFGPLTDYLANQLGRPVRLETAPNYTEFFRRTLNQRYDILFTAPHFYYLAQRKAGYRVLVRVDAPIMRAIIVVPKDSNIENVEHLRGKRLATVDQLSLATALLKVLLTDHGINPDKDLTLVTTPTHNASLLSVYNRVTDAASLMRLPFERAKKKVKDNVKIIATTSGTPHMPISVLPSISLKEAALIETALINLKTTTEGKALLKHLSWPGFVKTSPAEYDQLQWAAQQIKLPE